MPGPARRSSRSAAARNATLGKQGTLSFNNRVSKSGAVKVTGKDKNAELDSPIAAASPFKESQAKVEEVKIEEEEAEIGIDKPVAVVRAEKITDAQIRKYWKGVEEARLARRVHQEELATGEKVLRYFDASSQYGPCIGISRMKRWHRAERLGLHPPIEALAVLLKEASGNAEIERSAMDRLMSSTAVGSG